MYTRADASMLAVIKSAQIVPNDIARIIDAFAESTTELAELHKAEVCTEILFNKWQKSIAKPAPLSALFEIIHSDFFRIWSRKMAARLKREGMQINYKGREPEYSRAISLLNSIGILFGLTQIDCEVYCG